MTSSEDFELLVISYLYLKLIKLKKSGRKRYKRPSMAYRLNHSNYGYIQSVKRAEPSKFFNYLRMPERVYLKLFNLVKHDIAKCTVVKEPVPADVRLHITLRFVVEILNNIINN